MKCYGSISIVFRESWQDEQYRTLDARPERGAIRPSGSEVLALGNGQGNRVQMELRLERKWKRGQRTGSCRAGHTDVRINKGLATRGYDRRLGSVDVVASGEGAAAGRQASLLGQLLDHEGSGGHRACSGIGRFVELNAFRWV